MAKSYTPQDIHSLMNLLVKEATGQSNIAVVDSSTFVSAGETVLATGVENTLNSLAIVLGRTLMAVRPYKAKLQIINSMNTALYTSRLRKISFYARENEESGDWNTNLKTNLKTGYDNGSNGGASTASMWVQNQPVALEMNFGGQDVWETSTTIYEDQLKVAFRSEAEFAEFISGIMTEKANDIESTKEAYNRMAVLNHIAGTIDVDAVINKGSVINLTKAYNDEFGTSYTSEELRTTYLTEFLEFFVAEFKIASDYMTNRSANYHWSPAKSIDGTNYTLLRHTPKDKQRTILFSPLFTRAKSRVFPEIFNDQYLKMENYEGVTYWQSINTPSAIDVTPAIPDVAGTNNGAQTAGEEVSLDYVVGMIYDADALMIDYQLEAANTTPLEARKRYRNMWWTFSKNVIDDFTENTIVFIMKDDE